MTSPVSRGDLNTAPLTDPVDRRRIRAFFREFAAQNPSVRNHRGLVQRVVAGVGVAAGIVGFLAMLVGVSQELEENAPDMVGELVAMGGIALVMLLAAALLIWVYVRSRRRRGTPERHYRLAGFAAANRMTYLPGPYRGSHITPWAERGDLVLTRLMRPMSGRRVEYANFELISGRAGSRETRLGGYCAIRLQTALPHIVLESTDHPLTAITAGAIPDRAQRLSLEGGFDDHFRLYCPAGYERDALYLFTPDIMARLIDDVHDFDVEMIDDWLLLTRTGDVVTLDPATWNGIASAVGAITDKIRRWERWRDDREPAPRAPIPLAPIPSTPTRAAPRVTSTGRRLRLVTGRGTPLVMAAAGVFIVVMIAVDLLTRR